MTLTGLLVVLQTTGLAVAYRQWEQPPDLPYLLYYVDNSDNFGADNVAYAGSLNCIVELYSDRKLLSAETVIENVFRQNDLYFEKSESWISDENLCLVAYSINI
ncbi:MAG TPA: hypothetical protein VLH56_10550 [Dissulfurispiraceae bacterium]|nr:hypothetical protein [Dissulfurispiraceae bacterium]